MIIKQKNGTILEMTTKEFSELGHVLGSAVEAEAEVDGKTEVATDFKVGDKVEVIGKSVTGRDAFIGNTAVITFIDEIGDIQIVEGNGLNGWYPPSSLKLIEEEPEEVLSQENVKVGELFEVVNNVAQKNFPVGNVVRLMDSLLNDKHSGKFEDVVSGEVGFSTYKEIKRHTPEVLSEDNVKEGEYFVITDNTCAHKLAIGEVIKAKSHTGYARFKAEHMDESNWWYVKYTDVRRATDAEIAEATKPKEVKFEIGDVVKVVERFAVVSSEIDLDGDYYIRYIDSGQNRYYHPTHIRHATEEEKSHLQTLIGREKDEYKIGDLVELLSGSGSGYRGREGYIFEVDSISRAFIHLKDKGNKTNENDTYIHQEKLKLITPVEWRHDFI